MSGCHPPIIDTETCVHGQRHHCEICMPSNKELYNKLAELSQKIEMYYSRLREFEKQRIDPMHDTFVLHSQLFANLEDGIEKHQQRLIELEEWTRKEEDRVHEKVKKLEALINKVGKGMAHNSKCILSLDNNQRANEGNLFQRVKRLEELLDIQHKLNAYYNERLENIESHMFDIHPSWRGINNSDDDLELTRFDLLFPEKSSAPRITEMHIDEFVHVARASGMKNLTWKCTRCNAERPDSAISVAKHVFDDGIMTVNVKYCNDNDACNKFAHDREAIKKHYNLKGRK